MRGNAERGGPTPKHYWNRCSIPVWTPVSPTRTQNLGIDVATPERGCTEMEASTIKPPKHCGNRCSIPPANQTKPKNTGIDGATLKNGLQVTSKHGRLKRRDPQEIYQNTVENMQTQPKPKRCRNKWRNPQKGLQVTSEHSWKGGIPKKSSKTPREYRCATFLWQELQTQAKPKNEWRIPQKGLGVTITSKHCAELRWSPRNSPKHCGDRWCIHLECKLENGTSEKGMPS